MAATRRRIKPVPRHFVTTVPKPGRCVKCKARIMQAMVMGEPTSLEPVHLSLVGEAKALVLGIWTYAVTILGDGHPVPRAIYHIRDGLPRYAYIVPAHRCGVNWLLPMDLDDRQIERWRGEGKVNDECPF